MTAGTVYQASSERLPSGTGLSRFVSHMSLLPPDVMMSSGWVEHGAFAFWLIEKLAPHKYVELGTYSGYSYFVVCQAVRKLDLSTACYAVDTWSGDEHAGFYDDTVYNSVVAHNEKYKDFSTLVRNKFDDAARYFSDGSVDLLHVDGRHFYDDVKADFETWRPKLTDDAIVLFHDTNVRERDFGVWRFFDELKTDHATFEFMHGNGLGVLAIGKVPDALRDLFACGDQEADNVRSVYAQLGANLTQRWVAQDQQREARRLAGELKQLLAAHQTICTANGELQQKHLVLQRNHDDLAEAVATAQKALHSLVASDILRTARALGRLPLASNVARFVERARPATHAQVKSRDDETIATIHATGLFQTNYYLANNPDLLLTGIDPALHFARSGWKEERRPNPFFDPLYYLTQNPDVARNGENPLLHYADRGWKEGRRPSLGFDTAFYLERYPDVVAAGIDPLRHYLEAGRTEGREAMRSP